MLSWLLKIYALSQGASRLLLRAIWEVIRRFLMLLGDPSYRTTIHGKEMMLPVSHKLPLYVANCRYYDALPGRVSVYLHELHGSLMMIDVGANIGDTILYCSKSPQDQFLAIEVNPIFIKYLKRNLAQIKNVELVEAYCTFEDSDGIPVKISSANGTASIKNDEQGVRIPKRKLDTMIAEYPQFERCNFLKIDTDGGDFDVIRGAHQIIKQSTPLILMECDIFENKNFVSDFSESMDFFVRAGYENVIVYDNFGYLFDVFALRDYAQFKFALFHQLTSKFGYYDLLMLHQKHRSFIDMEVAYFASALSEETRRSIAKNILDL